MHLISCLKSVINFWYLDDGNFADRAHVAKEDLLTVIRVASQFGLELNPTKCELIFLGKPCRDQMATILADFETI